MKEKKLIKEIFIWISILVAVYFAVQIIVGLSVGRDFTDVVSANGASEEYSIDNITVEVDNKDVLVVKEIYEQGDKICIKMSPVSRGEAFVELIDNNTAMPVCSEPYKVSSTMIITNQNTGNFTYYRIYFAFILAFCIILMALLWAYFGKSYKKLRYSYVSIFTSGFALWMTIQVTTMLYAFIMNLDMLNVYYYIRTTAFNFIIYTAPIMLIFSALLSISNISLIKHEGYAFSNVLGILLSVVIFLGLVFIMGSTYLSPNGKMIYVKIYYSVISIFWAIYALMECFLFGSVLCGSLNAKHKPSLDKDYIIILGCKIRKDGTLYPLIRGRVDRALEFYNEQKAKTGKASRFVVSGGQGNDEIISEAQAMYNYLLEQGIDESEILLENKSVNTKENMQFSYKLIDDKNAKVAFSTTNYHVFRSGIISRQQGFEPDGMGAKTKWYFWPNAFIREVVGMVTYSWKLLIVMLIPIVLFLITVQFYF